MNLNMCMYSDHIANGHLPKQHMKQHNLFATDMCKLLIKILYLRISKQLESIMHKQVLHRSQEIYKKEPKNI